MSVDFSGGNFIDLLHTILKNPEAVQISDKKLLSKLEAALTTLHNDLSDGDYMETDEANEAYTELRDHYNLIYDSHVELEDDDELEVKKIDDSDEVDDFESDDSDEGEPDEGDDFDFADDDEDEGK